MKKIKKKKCRHCKRLFVPDPRNRNRQRYCSRTPCRKASKSTSQKKWLLKPENKDHFKGPENVERVREWRKKNPGYWKRSKTKIALQDPLNEEPTENTYKSQQNRANALQDFLMSQPPVMIGLISNFIGSPLQDDIANTLLAMQKSGQDILYLQSKGGKNDRKNTSIRTTYPQDPQKLQLGRSPAG
jgi:hypothetical protein